MRINNKILEIENFLEELNSIKPNVYEDYLDIKTKAACERYIELIVESTLDLIFLLIKERDLKTPKDNRDAIEILIDDDKLKNALINAKGMRNILVHQYGEVDNKIIFDSLIYLEKDIKKLIKKIEINYKKI